VLRWHSKTSPFANSWPTSGTRRPGRIRMADQAFWLVLSRHGQHRLLDRAHRDLSRPLAIPGIPGNAIAANPLFAARTRCLSDTRRCLSDTAGDRLQRENPVSIHGTLHRKASQRWTIQELLVQRKPCTLSQPEPSESFEPEEAIGGELVW
jgi:hypothetical protein